MTEDNVLYLSENKKETKSWFQALGAQMPPLGGNKSGFIRSISFDSETVKSDSEKGTMKQGRVTPQQDAEYMPQSRTPYQRARDILVSYAEDAKNTKVREEYVGEYVERVKRLDRKQIRLYEAESNLALALDRNDQSAIDVYTKRVENIQDEINKLSEGLQKMEESHELRSIVRREKEATRRQTKKEGKTELKMAVAM